MASPPIPISLSLSSIPKPPFLLYPNPRLPFLRLRPISLSLALPSRLPTPRVSTSPGALEAEEKEQGGVSEEGTVRTRPCELYVCNLPRSCGVEELLELFKPFGTVQSVEVSRNTETGVSKGCGYVTMASLQEAKAAIAALDGSDLDGREMRVKYSADMVVGRKNTGAQNTTTKRIMIFESPYKVYVGNLAWSVRPDDLREYCSQFGTVISTRLLQDKKAGKTRVYGFVSFAAENEVKAAVATTGTEFRGRNLLIREVVPKE